MATTKKQKPAAAKKSATTKPPARKGPKAASQSKSKGHDGVASKPDEKKARVKAKAKSAGKSGKRTAASKKPATKSSAASRTAGTKSRKPATRRPAAHAAAGRGHQAASNGHHGERAAQLPATAQAAAPKRPRTEHEERISHGLFQALEGFASSHELGRVMAQGRFDWGEIEDPGLDPDLAFVSYERFEDYRNVPTNLTWHVVPDLVVEIVRDDEETKSISQWLEAYFQAGVRRVWVVYPRQLKVHDHESVSSSRVVGRNQALEGGDVLPGFHLPLKDLMAEGKA